MDNFMIKVIPFDFDVEILAEREYTCLFYGFRQDHFHFINYYQNYVIQYHIPRSHLAYNLNLLFEMLSSLPDAKNLIIRVAEGFVLTVNSIDDITINTGSQQYHLVQQDAPEFFGVLNRDIEIYRQAKELVKFEENGNACFLEGIDPINKAIARSEDGNTALLAAIAFEHLTIKNLKRTKKLTITALYNDLLKKKYEVPDEWFMELAPGLQYLADEETEEGILKIYRKLIEQGHLDAFMEDEAVGLGNYADLIYFAYKQLSDVQKIQFKTLVNLHGVNFILPLALVTRIIDQRQYNDFVNMGFQPDSKEEQQTRYETGVVDAFGEYFG